MDTRTFVVAVAPVIGAAIVLDVVYQLFSPPSDISALRDISAVDWAVLIVSLLVFPLWAGTRVARTSRKRRWYALGGVSVLLGTFVGVALAELFEASPFDSSWLFGLVAILALSPLNALLGFVGGAFQRRGVGHVA
jgi:hypothetical protein